TAKHCYMGRGLGDSPAVTAFESRPRGWRRVSSGAVGAKRFTSRGVRAVHPDASIRVIGQIPLRPAENESHVAGAVSPTGVTAPNPVIATRRSGWATGMTPK